MPNTTLVGHSKGESGSTVLQFLLKRADIDPNLAGRDGRTPLLLAIAKGAQGAVQLLLERTDLDPNLVDKDGRTPLEWAAAEGNQTAVELLLGRADINTGITDSEGLTPLEWATRQGHHSIVEHLLVHQPRTILETIRRPRRSYLRMITKLRTRWHIFSP